MKLIFSYDVENKTLDVIDSNGAIISNLKSISINKYGDKYDCSLMRQNKDDNGMDKTEIWSCYAGIKESLENFVRGK